jgi:hypothetical protein
MSVSIEPNTVTPPEMPAVSSRPVSKAARRPLLKRVLHVVRRGHLYFGLFLFPWAILYGVTAFLFNHPTAFSEQPTTTFGTDTLTGTPMETVPNPTEQANQVIAALNEKQKPATPYTLGVGEVKYNREFAFATVKAEGQTVSVLVDVKNGGGTIRSAIDKPKAELPPRAPFAVGSSERGRDSGRRAGGTPALPGKDGIKLSDPLPERVKTTIPTLLERTGFPTGEVTVTSVPDLVFPVEADGKTWNATYNAVTGAVSGTTTDAKPETELGWRRFLLRLHTAHGYPGEQNARWFWAVIVDLMAGVMCFWGVSGLLMWWQIKATRKAGAVTLVLSAIVATAIGVAMHAAMTG